MRSWFLCLVALVALPLVVPRLARAGDVPAGEKPALPAKRLTQAQMERGRARLIDIRVLGMRLFTTPFNRHDGYGDGPSDPSDPLTPGGRPTLQGNGTLLRINGLDAQTCLECHSIVRATTTPPTLGIGGVGGSNSNAIIMPTQMDMADVNGTAGFNGRFANPPFLFGAGGVELLGLEMTADLQALRAEAIAHPGRDVDLLTKGVYFGTIRANEAGEIDTTDIQGVGDDLVVRPFGRKGEFATVREFDTGALMFHLGMQPTEVVGTDVDADGDGVENEILPGDLSALHAFGVTLEHPFQERLPRAARRGRSVFASVGCADCHKPALRTSRRRLPLRFPEVATEPFRGTFLRIDLGRGAWGFEAAHGGGLTIPLFSDLKRHDMGEDLKESFHGADDDTNRSFVTARLWGIADSAPYLHDGRATTLTDAILAHGGEAQPTRERFENLTNEKRRDLLAFLRTLRTPADPARDLRKRVAKSAKDAGHQDDEHQDDEHPESGKRHHGREKAPRRNSWFRTFVRWLLG